MSSIRIVFNINRARSAIAKVESCFVLALTCTMATVAVASPAAAQPRQRQILNGGLPAVSPDGNLIAFSATRDTLKPAQVYVIRVDGTGERQISTEGSNGQPQWYAKGSRILFSGMKGMMTVKPDGTDPRPFAASGGRGYAPSPDDKRLVYSTGTMPSVQLAVSAFDGSAERRIDSGPGMAFNGVFSPDGKTIAFAKLDSTRDMQVYLVNTDGSNLRKMTNFSGNDGRPQWPSWSPDGKTLAVQAGVYNQQNPGGNTAHIWLLDVATGSAKKLAVHEKAYLDETPSFFPDGRRIAFQSDRTGRMEIWIMNVDGSGARQLTK